jgi:hypothetical protein
MMTPNVEAHQLPANVMQNDNLSTNASITHTQPSLTPMHACTDLSLSGSDPLGDSVVQATTALAEVVGTVGTSSPLPSSNYMLNYQNLQQLPLSLENLPLNSVNPTIPNGYNMVPGAINSPMTTAFPAVCTPPPTMTPHMPISSAAAAAAAAVVAAAAASAGTYPCNPLTPMMTPITANIPGSISPSASFPEFHEYNRRHYELSTDPEARRRARMSHNSQDDDSLDEQSRSRACALNAELRRQIHIQSEQKRRAQIKDGFEHLREQLPNCGSSKKISKAAILNKTVLFIQQLKHSHLTLMAEVERLAAENERLRRRIGEETPGFSLVHRAYTTMM